MKLRLIEEDYRILRAFQGQSSLRTYLTTVVLNLARDHRIREWGKWRPSAAAERLGEVGVQLDTLLHRDDRSLREAIELLRERGVGLSAEEVTGMAARLPVRTPRRLEGEGALAGRAAPDRAEQGLLDEERASVLERARQLVEGTLRQLPVEDRLVLKLHFIDGLTIAAIARGLGLEQRPLYPRIHRALATLRRALEAAGLGGPDILEATGWAGADVTLDFGLAGSETGGARPSNSMQGHSPREGS